MTRISRAALASAFGLLLAGTAWGADVTVNVTGLDGQPARDVVVWVAGTAKAAPRAATAPTDPVLIEQLGLQFLPVVTIVRTGTVVRFTNRDPYDHHVRSVPSGPLGAQPPAKTFELRLSADDPKARSADIVADKAGIIGLGCHLHSSMRGTLFVTDAPAFAKTDARGVATLSGLPEGPAEIRLWHAEQLADQPAHPMTVEKAGAATIAQLNFSPRRRR